eukprot:4057862-Ditylum_brightwellii.AAC.1
MDVVPKKQQQHLAFWTCLLHYLFGNKDVHAVEMEVDQIICVFGETAMDGALLKESNLTFEANMKEWNVSPYQGVKSTFKEYISLPEEKKPLITLAVCFDVG